MSELIDGNEVYAIVGAAMDVYNSLGPGFLEAVYQEALEIELSTRHIPFAPQHQLHIRYKDRWLTKFYVADLLVFGRVIVELKALDQLRSQEEAQLLNYLKATGFEVGLLLNFGAPGKLQWKRMVRSQKPSIPPSLSRS
jgi:GxxExxY protein